MGFRRKYLIGLMTPAMEENKSRSELFKVLSSYSKIGGVFLF